MKISLHAIIFHIRGICFREVVLNLKAVTNYFSLFQIYYNTPKSLVYFLIICHQSPKIIQDLYVQISDFIGTCLSNIKTTLGFSNQLLLQTFKKLSHTFFTSSCLLLQNLNLFGLGYASQQHCWEQQESC